MFRQTGLVEKLIQRRWIQKSFLTTSNTENFTQTTAGSPSYIHQTDTKPLLYRNIGQHLRLAVERYPNNEALVACHEAKRYSFTEAMEKVDRLAAAFYQIGLQKGDRIGIWAPNCSAYYLTNLAVARAGMISVGINPAYQLPELEYALNKVEVKALVTIESFRSQNYYNILNQLIPELANNSTSKIKSSRVPALRSIIMDAGDKKFPGTISFQDLNQLSSEQGTSAIDALQSSISPDSGACLLFTSGTTGQPKAALLSHFGMVNNGTHCALRNEFDRKHKRICLQVPLFHVFGMVLGAISSLSYGSTLVFPGAAFNAGESLKAIVDEKCTVIYGTPTMYVDLMNEYRKGKVNLPRMDIAVIGAAACSPKLLTDIEETLGVEHVRGAYGMTETSGATFIADRGDKTTVSLDSVGRVVDHHEVKVVDRDGKTVPFGQAGELWLRGYGTMLGFWGDEDKTKEAIGADRWFRTGDQFVLQPDGYGKVVGRLKEVIIRGGENIYPKEIEDVLNTHSKVLETHCIGVPDDRLGEEICAYVRLKECTEENVLNMPEIIQYCKVQLAHFKIPKHLRIVKQFPKTASGKIQKFRLLEMYLNENK